MRALLFLASAMALSACATSSSEEQSCSTPVPQDPQRSVRESCTFAAGAKVGETIGFTAEQRKALPIKHVVVVMQENRAFDHYFGQLSLTHPDVEPVPATWASLDDEGKPVAPFHLTDVCTPADPPHGWEAMHGGWDEGKMDGWVKGAANSKTDGRYVMGYYDESDIPFYYWLARTFAISDHFFSATLGPTWPNRDFMYAATSDGIKATGERTMTNVKTIFDALDEAGVAWGVYTNGMPRQDALGWNRMSRGVFTYQDFLDQLSDETLPQVAFVDPSFSQDEHPVAPPSGGEQWAAEIYQHAVVSPLWPSLAVFYTYDEAGGFADHMPPPAACPPSPELSDFDRLGIRIPVFVISPWARAHYVSHATHELTSVVRFIELVHDLPSLTARDANSDAMLDLFDFGCPSLLKPPEAPAAGQLECE